MTFEHWLLSVPQCITADPLWSMKAYRLGLFLADLAWSDVTKLVQDRRTLSLSDQLYRATGSISANFAEGYSRGTGKDRARFYEYALGSARESRDWYYKARHTLGTAVADHHQARTDHGPPAAPHPRHPRRSLTPPRLKMKSSSSYALRFTN